MYLFKCVIPSCCRCTGAVDGELPPSGSKVADVGCKDSIQRFDPSEINALVTSPRNSTVIGEGGSSIVYLARLPGSVSTTPTAAFKVHDRASERLYRMFRQELDVLCRVDHPNIVRLLGYSDDGDQAGVLVLEHVTNGTLHDMLHGSTPLSWPQRMSVAFQLAKALDYLHEGCDLQIIHGDVKASNVLLDRNLNPKLCDFGFARAGFAAVVARSANPMMGSPGYVDPCYLRTGLVSKKSDVYSYGVLVLELITGAEAFSSEKSPVLTTAMRPLLQEVVSEGVVSRVGEIVDRRLVSGGYNGGEVATMAKIAAQCIEESPSKRPSMKQVLRIMGSQ